MAYKQLIWFDSNNNEFDFTSANYVRVLKGMKGFQMPPIDYVEDEVPFLHGTKLRQIKVKARELDLPIKVSCPDSGTFAATMRNLLKTFNPLNNDGRLRMVSYDGVKRDINCRYVSGFEMDESTENSGDTWQNAIGVFRAFDPFWYDISPTIITFTNGSPATFLQSPFLPLKITSSTIFGNQTITVNGDVETNPTWVITGPGDSIVINNLTTGESINLNYSLGAGEYINIDTNEGKKTVTKNDGTNLYQYLSNDSSLWSLQAGVNNIQIQMQNSGTASSVQLSYTNRYWGGL